MPKESEDKKRIISLGFVRPEELMGDTIYVDFRYKEIPFQIRATAYSNEKFISHPKAIDGNMLCKSERYATTKTERIVGSTELDYNEFIKDLTGSNNGRVIDQRLIEDGSRLVTKILQVSKLSDIKLLRRPQIGTEEKP